MNSCSPGDKYCRWCPTTINNSEISFSCFLSKPTALLQCMFAVPASINKDPTNLRVCIAKSQCSNTWDRGDIRTAKSQLVEHLNQKSHPKPFHKRMIFKRTAKAKQGRTDKLDNNAKPTFLLMFAETKQNNPNTCTDAILK